MSSLPTAGWPQRMVCLMLFMTVCPSANFSLKDRSVPTNNCAFQSLMCKKRPRLLCAAGEDCISVALSFSPFKTIVCEAECKPVSLSNSTNTTTELPEIINGTMFSTDFNTSLPNTTEADGSLNSSYCHKNFFCQNGGKCSERSFTGSSFRPECICPKGWQGTFCQIECSLNCHGNGYCLVLNGTQLCNCHINYSSPDCKFLTTTADPVVDHEPIYIPVVTCISVLVFLLLGYFLILRLRWRSLFVTKLFHYLQPYEDDGKQKKN